MRLIPESEQLTTSKLNQLSRKVLYSSRRNVPSYPRNVNNDITNGTFLLHSVKIRLGQPQAENSRRLHWFYRATQLC